MPLMLEIPDAAVAAMQLSPAELEKELRQDLAVALYARGALPVGVAMELAGLTRREFEGLLKVREVRRPFDTQELARELS